MARYASNSNTLPAYQRIENDLRSKIRIGDWTEGALLPSRHTLAAEYKVGVGTIEKAISKLLADGTLRASDRSGTYVNEIANRTKSVVAGIPDEPVRKTGVLGIAIGVDHSNFSPSDSLDIWSRVITSKIEQRFRDKVARVIVRNAYSDDRKPWSLAETVEQLTLSGATILCVDNLNTGFGMRTIAGLDALVKAEKWPIVCILPVEHHGNVPQVNCNLAQSGFLAVEHFVRSGQKEMTLLAPCPFEWVQDRIASAHKAVSYFELPSSYLQVVLGETELARRGAVFSQWGYENARQLIRSGTLRSAVFAINDAVAYGVLRAAEEASLVPGHDFELIGVDDTLQSQERGLSTFCTPVDEVAFEVEHLLDRVIDRSHAGMRVNLRPVLIERSTTRIIDATRAAR